MILKLAQTKGQMLLRLNNKLEKKTCQAMLIMDSRGSQLIIGH